MAYQIKILMLAFAIAFVISLIVIPILRRRKIGQQERDDGPKSHLKKQGTPTMGGIVMILAIIIIGAIVFFKYSKSVDASEQTMAKNLIPLILVTVGFGLVGFVDDFKNNSICENVNYIANLAIHTIYHICYAWNYKCN